MIEFRHVTKAYKDVTAIDDMSFTLSEEGIYCLLGRNGAGKTTLMKLLSGRLPVTSGSVRVGGRAVNTLNMPDDVQYIESAQKQFNMRIAELIDLAAGLDERFDKSFAMRMVEKFHLDKKKKYHRLSFGMQTMVTTLMSLSSNKGVILLDEPVLGFDAIMRAQFYELLSESFAKHPRIIMVSTHLIDEIATVADGILMIEGGKMILREDINAIAEKAYKLTGTAEDVAIATQGLNVLSIEQLGKYAVAYLYDERTKFSGALEVSDLSLQELFVKMVGGKDHE